MAAKQNTVLSRREIIAFFLVALTAGLKSTVIATVTLGAFAVADDGKMPINVLMHPVRLIGATFFLGMFSLPISALVAFPLMLLLRDASETLWLIISIVFGILIAAIIGQITIRVLIPFFPLAGFLFGAFFGLFAILGRRTIREKSQHTTIE